MTIVNLKIYVLVLITITFIKSKLFAQQDAQHSLYFFNPHALNPAYSGSKNCLNITANIRDQWTGFKGAPKSQWLNMHTPLKNEKIAVGLSLINDRIGSSKSTSAFADLTYRLKLNGRKTHLSFSLRGGIDFLSTNYSNLTITDNTDDLYINGLNYKTSLFNMGAGTYLNSEKLFIGFSSPRLINNKLNNSNNSKSKQETHLYLTAGYVFNLSSSLKLKPSFLVKYVNNSPVSTDINLSILIFERLWIGAMYRYNSAYGLNTMIVINNNLQIGYAYDYTTNTINNYINGSHEIMISYSFMDNYNKGLKSPRYF